MNRTSIITRRRSEHTTRYSELYRRRHRILWTRRRVLDEMHAQYTESSQPAKNKK